MPATRKRTRYRRRYKRRTKRKSYQTALSLPMPNRKMCKLRYCDYVSLDAGAGVSSTWVFRANDLYDPNFSGVGHQPLGFDQLVNVFYDHFTVLGARIKATFQTTSAAATANSVLCGIELKDNTVYIANPIQIREQRNNNTKIIGALGSSKTQCTITKTFSAKKFFGMSNLIGLADYRGDAASSPLEQAHFVTWVAAADSATDIPPINISVEIEYIAVLTEPKHLLGS